MTPNPPSPEKQIEFLRNVQRLLSEGSFVATYKYALLHALADLAVERGDDSGAPLRLSTLEIAERFVSLYWLQAAPFRGRSRLRQNTGTPAAVLNRVEEARQESGGSLARLKQDERAWTRLLREVERTVRAMPLWKLQTVGRSALPFLYENSGQGREIELRPGVAFCLRAYYALLVDLVRAAWVRYVRRHNGKLLGERTDLYAFLFGAERDPSLMARSRHILRDAQDGRCLYCSRGVRAAGQVDHFIPWARYPIDLGHNLVLAHGSCNQAKSDHLASEAHLEGWLERNQAHAGQLDSAFDGANVMHDRPASLRIAAWAYAQVAAARGLVWTGNGGMDALSGRWRSLLGQAHPTYAIPDSGSLAADRSERT